MTETVKRIDYRDIAELDLDSISHIPDDGLESYFTDLANMATAGQLIQFLGVDPAFTYAGDDEDDAKNELVQKYVERRLKVVREFRSRLSVFSGALDALDGL